MRGARWLLLTALLMMCAGCGRAYDVETEVHKEREQIALSWWGNAEAHADMLDALAAFERRNQDLELVPEYGTHENAAMSMDMRYAAHESYDVIQIDYEWLHKYSEDGTGFYNIDDVQKQINYGNFSRAERALGMMNGKLNALPVSIDTPVIYWDPEVLEQYGISAPSTWTELFAAAKQAAANGGSLIRARQELLWVLALTYEQQRTGRELYSLDGEKEFTKADFEDLISVGARMMENGVISVCDVTKDTASVYAGALTWNNEADEEVWELIGKDIGELQAGVALTPDGRPRAPWLIRPPVMYAIGRDTKSPENAAKVLNFLLNGSSVLRCRGLDRGVPVSDVGQQVLLTAGLMQSPQLDGYKNLERRLSTTRILLPLLEDEELGAQYLALVCKVGAEECTLQEAAEILQDLFARLCESDAST